MAALSTIKKYFPNVTRVLDAKEDAVVEVTRRDESTSKRRKHGQCAMAVAAKRCFKVDGVIISISKAFLINEDTAIRYDLPQNIAREVISFDRGAGFAPGVYTLKKPVRSLGSRHSTGKKKKGIDTGAVRHLHHITSGIRTVLGSKEIS